MQKSRTMHREFVNVNVVALVKTFVFRIYLHSIQIPVGIGKL